MQSTRFAILGAGPTGIGAALRLLELGERDFVLIDAADAPGGLAASCVDPQGFTWDLGGHVQFSHYRKFDEYMDLAFPADEWLWHERESWIWLRDRFVPYPFQNNLHRLSAEDRWSAVQGLVAAHAASHRVSPKNFREWILATFGEGIAAQFMLPYNFKVWAHPPETMSYRWIGERVAVPSLDDVLRSICLGQDQVSWGPNRRFRFPLRGGTGAIWRSLGSKIPAGNLKMSARAASIAGQSITFEDGSRLRYEALINTAPLNWLARALGDPVLSRRTSGLKSSTVHVVGIGLRGAPPEAIRKMCWMYFPGEETSFYRVTVFSNYSPYNVPEPGAMWSLMAEVSESEHARRDRAGLIDRVAREMRGAGLIRDEREIASRWHKVLTPGYPTPSLERDAILNDVLPALEEKRIYSRGRFGAWKYEVSNQDHSFMQGVEVVDRLMLGHAEPTLEQPEVVNRAA
ncbi:MAG: FAD-dependent oxidoreductase [Acidobacteriia bacterium]|nr:FAD-dependent oxidoreductase [Terriglobia bacterium]